MKGYTCIGVSDALKAKIDELAGDRPITHFIGDLLEQKETSQLADLIELKFKHLDERLNEVEARLKELGENYELMNRVGWQQFLDVQKQVISMIASNGLMLSAMDQLVQPGIKEKILEQGKEVRETMWAEYMRKTGWGSPEWKGDGGAPNWWPGKEDDNAPGT